MLHDNHRKWIADRGIDPTLAEKMGLTTVRDGGGAWLTIPYIERGQEVNHKYRLTSEKRHRMDKGAPLTWWNHDCLLDDQVQAGEAPVVITEGEWDAMVAMQCGFRHVISVPNGGSSQKTEGVVDPENDEKGMAFVWRCRALTDKVKTFILAIDADDTGRILASELARRLGPERCRFVSYPDGCKDLNDVLRIHDLETARECISLAKPYPVKGLYRLSDFPLPPEYDRIAMGIDGLDELLPIVPGTLTVFSGYAGQGKTSLSMAMLANVMGAGIGCVVASFETSPRPIMERRLLACLLHCSENDLHKHNVRQAQKVLEEHLALIAQMVGEDQEMGLDELLDLAATAVIRDGARVLFIDPWNEIEHKRRSDESETDYTGRAIRALKQFARQYDVAVWVVAHPAKPDPSRKMSAPGLYQISGSAHWANKPDYGVIAWRPDINTNEVEVLVTKVRMGLPGKLGTVKLAYDWRNSTYSAAA